MMKKVLVVAVVAGIAMFAGNCGSSEQKQQVKQAMEMAEKLQAANADGDAATVSDADINLTGIWKSDVTGAQIEFTADKFYAYQDGKKNEDEAVDYKVENGTIKFCADGICFANTVGLIIVNGKPNFGGHDAMEKVN